MRGKIFFILLSITLAVWCGHGIAVAGDVDDNIEIDDNMDAYDNMGDPDKNINFIKLKAKSQAARRQKLAEKGVQSGGTSDTIKGGGAMNSVVMGAGSNVKGDIIIIDESKGDKTQVVE